MRRDCVAELDDWIVREIREEDPRSYLRCIPEEHAQEFAKFPDPLRLF